MGPKIVAEALWRAEGFTDVQYQRIPAENLKARLGALASNATDIETTFVGPFLSSIDAGDPIVILAGLHAGCFELFGGQRVLVRFATSKGRPSQSAASAVRIMPLSQVCWPTSASTPAGT